MANGQITLFKRRQIGQSEGLQYIMQIKEIRDPNFIKYKPILYVRNSRRLERCVECRTEHKNKTFTYNALNNALNIHFRWLKYYGMNNIFT